MDASFTLVTDPARGLIEIGIRGFLSVAQVHAYAAERAAAIARLGLAPNAHCSLYDLTAAPLQSQEVMALFQMMVEDGALASRRLAFILGTSAIGMQIRRIVRGRDAVACFDMREAAERWLFDPATTTTGRAA